MSIESTVLSQVFNIDNWAKYPLIDLRGKFPDVTDEWDIVFSETNPTVCRADLHYIKDCKKNTGKYPVLLNIRTTLAHLINSIFSRQVQSSLLNTYY